MRLILDVMRGYRAVLVCGFLHQAPVGQHTQRRLHGYQEFRGELISRKIKDGKPVTAVFRRAQRPDLSFLVRAFLVWLDEIEPPARLRTIDDTHLERRCAYAERIEGDEQRVGRADAERDVHLRRVERAELDAIDGQAGGEKQQRIGQGVERGQAEGGVSEDAASGFVEP